VCGNQKTIRSFPHISYQRVCKKNNTTGATSGAGTAYASVLPEYTPGFYIPAAPVYGVYISQLIRYSRVRGFYQDVLDRGLLVTRKLLSQLHGFLLVKFGKFYGRHHAVKLVNHFGISVSQMTIDMFRLS